MTPIVRERVINAPPARVYRYLTDSERWAEWQGSSARLDPTPGGLFSMTMPDGATARGEFIELVPDTKVVFSWGWIDHPGVPPGSSTVTIELIGDGQTTLVRLTHMGLADDAVEMHSTGWDRYVPRLALAAEGHPSGPE
jgi:uncharacterized protein YndB with AHSA1/START domain